MRKNLIAAGAIVGAVMLTSSGCMDKAVEPYRDAKVGARDDRPAKVFTMPDGFNNFAFKCNETTGVYTLYHADAKYGGISTVANDPACPR